MIHEFALEPEAVSNWRDFRYFIERFGAEHGRLIAQFPKKWKRYVIEACTETGLNRTRIVERLKTVDSKLVRSGRPYDPEQPWLDNALAQHDEDPFAGIIARANPTGHADVMEADAVDATEPRWTVPRERTVARQASDLAETIAPLIRVSKRILLVDPYFTPTVQRYKHSLRAILQQGLNGHLGVEQLEVHSRSVGNTTAAWRNDCELSLCALLPPGIELALVRWEDTPGGEVMHARYVLTEIGGLRIDHGLDEGAPGQTTDVALLATEFAQERWTEYEQATSPFVFVDRITIRSSR